MASTEEFLALSRRYLLDDYRIKIERCLEMLSDEQLWWRPNDDSNSIGNLLLHLSGNVRQYIVTGAGGQADTRRRREEFDVRETSREELLSQFQATLEEVGGVLARIDPDELGRRCTLQGREMTKLEAIYHAVEHFSMHTGQIIYITKLLAGRDLDFYAFKGDNVERRW